MLSIRWLNLPKAIEMMKRREAEILRALLHLSDETKGFTDPEIIMIGGYALRAFISLSRFTRDCDFAVRKENGWNIDRLKKILPKGYSVQEEEKRDSYGFLRCIKFLRHDRARIKISMDFMEGEIRGRESEDIVLIDEEMIKNRKFVEMRIAGKPVKVAVPDYVDYFIMKVISSRASDIRDIASLIYERGIPTQLKKRVKQILPFPEVFKSKIGERVISEIRRTTFLNSWKGIFGTQRYTEKDKKKVMELLEKCIKSLY